MTIRKVREGRGSGRGRAARSRGLERHEARVDSQAKRLLKAEGDFRELSKRPLKPCPDCGCYKRENRKFFNGSWGWTPFCTKCWLRRGKPRVQESIQIAEDLEVARRAEAEAERQRAVDAGERPW
jgi:hypothetical protein